jgi:hypothetical protein
MKLLGLAYLAVLLGVSSATEQMQINYYSDSGCSDYIGQIDVTWATYYFSGTKNCYNYNYGNSVNIANCYESTECYCYFYQQENCVGNGAIVASGTNNNCLADSSAYYSFACYYR